MLNDIFMFLFDHIGGTKAKFALAIITIVIILGIPALVAFFKLLKPRTYKKSHKAPDTISSSYSKPDLLLYNIQTCIKRRFDKFELHDFMNKELWNSHILWFKTHATVKTNENEFNTEIAFISDVMYTTETDNINHEQKRFSSHVETEVKYYKILDELTDDYTHLFDFKEIISVVIYRGLKKIKLENNHTSVLITSAEAVLFIACYMISFCPNESTKQYIIEKLTKYSKTI